MIEDRTIEANLKNNNKKNNKANSIQRHKRETLVCTFVSTIVGRFIFRFFMNFEPFVFRNLFLTGGYAFDVTVAMLLDRNKETTDTLEKQVELISMKTKEYSIGSHFESSLNWAQNNTKSFKFNRRNNRKALLIQYNHTKDWPWSWYCVVYLVSFVSSNVLGWSFCLWRHGSHVGHQNKGMAAILAMLVRLICVQTKGI